MLLGYQPRTTWHDPQHHAVATTSLDDKKIRRVERRLVGKNCNLDLPSRTRAIGIIVERAGRLIVDDPVEHVLGLLAEMKKVVLEDNIVEESEVFQAGVV